MSLSWDLLEHRRQRQARQRLLRERWRQVRQSCLAWSLAWFGVAVCCVLFAYIFYGFFSP